MSIITHISQIATRDVNLKVKLNIVLIFTYVFEIKNMSITELLILKQYPFTLMCMCAMIMPSKKIFFRKEA